MHTKQLIITADDYGMCDGVNKAIEECISSKVVLSTNVMANMDKAEEASKLKYKFPYVSVGLHYNFTVGTPLSPIDRVKSLVGKDGCFLSYNEIRQKCRNGTYSFDEILL